jgi:hypothetical protein
MLAISGDSDEKYRMKSELASGGLEPCCMLPQAYKFRIVRRSYNMKKAFQDNPQLTTVRMVYVHCEHHWSAVSQSRAVASVYMQMIMTGLIVTCTLRELLVRFFY